jgi:seryl-tRNA synthetase
MTANQSRVLSPKQIALFRRAYPMTKGPTFEYGVAIKDLCDSHDAAIARIEEAETLRKLCDENEALMQRYMGSSVKKLIEEAETLRSQLDAAQKERNALERELAEILPGSKHADRPAARVAAPREPT